LRCGHKAGKNVEMKTKCGHEQKALFISFFVHLLALRIFSLSEYFMMTHPMMMWTMLERSRVGRSGLPDFS
jgi:hypothetical protein